MKFISKYMAVIIPMMALLFLTNSCSKDNRKFILNVTAVVNEDERVANALLRIYVPSDRSFIDYYYSTDEQGEFSLEFENEVVVEVQAVKGSFSGCNFCQIKRGQNYVEVELKPYGADDNGCSENTP